MALLTRFAMRPMAAVLAVLACSAIGGCNVAGYAAHVIGERKTVVLPAYRGLENQSIAVMVTADEFTRFTHPQVTDAVGRAVSSSLASNVPGVRVMDPRQMAQFQEQNPFWMTLPPADVVQRLAVDRLVVIDLVEFTTHEPGNAHLWRGVVVANIDVLEADVATPNNAVYHTTVKTMYPPGNGVGVLNHDDPTMRLGMIKTLATTVSNLFAEYEVVRQ